MAYVSLGSKPVGSIVKLRENGVPTDYLVVHQGLPGAMYDASCNGTWLLRKDIFENREWRSGNDNDYAASTIKSYLDNTFLNRFEVNIRNAIKQVKIPYRPGSGDSMSVNSGANGLSCKIFLLSGYEMGWTDGIYPNLAPEGAKLAYFEFGSTASADYKRIAYLSGSAANWWIRSPFAMSSIICVWYIFPSGGAGGAHSNNAYGVRPALVLPSSLSVSDDGSVTTNTAPGVPAWINAPDSISGGGTITVSWGAAGDAEGNLAGYQLERSVNGGGWGLIYQGGALAANDAITWGWNTVAYRVRAYDSESAFSGYQTGPTRSVFNNQPPAISGSDGSLGAKTGAFSTAYTVSDANPGQNVAVVETLDGNQKRAFNVTNSLACSFDVTAAEWRELTNGTHTMKITATDAAGAAVARTLTFQKNETEIDVTAVLPQAPAAMPTKGILTVSRQIPLGSNMIVEVCNNARDAAPAWQDITTAVKNGQKFFISNIQKTAAQWGVGIRVRVYRLGAAGECWISAIGGNFE